jgi:hypothetical protein
MVDASSRSEVVRQASRIETTDLIPEHLNPEATTQARPWHLSLEFIVGASGFFLKITAPSRKGESPIRISHASVKTTCVFRHSQISAH